MAAGATKIHAAGADGARGMPSKRAVSGSWAKVMPPSSLMHLSPAVPSEAVPESTTPIADIPRSTASERKKASTGICCPASGLFLQA